MTSTNEKIAERSILINRILYGSFLLLGIYFLASRDISNAMSNLAIGLVFDPFDQKITWPKRPQYQKIWLIVHLSLVFGLLAIMIAERFG